MGQSLVFFLSFLFFGSSSYAKLEFPRELSTKDRRQIVETLGYGAAQKILGNPYPLGGSSGIEIGISREFIPSQGISQLGSKTSAGSDLAYNQVSFAKGLYYDFDFFVSFIPMGQAEEVSGFGGGVRWSFHEAEYLPFHLAIQAVGHTISFQDEVNVTTQTIDLLGSFQMNDVSLYSGFGTIRSSGLFMGGATNLTDSDLVESETVSSQRLFFGASWNLGTFFIAGEISRVSDPSYGIKFGSRF